MVFCIRNSGVVCKIMVKDWDGTSKLEESFKRDRRTVYNVRLLGVGGFLFLLSLLVLLYSKAGYHVGTTPIVVLPLVSRYKLQVRCSDYDITLL